MTVHRAAALLRVLIPTLAASVTLGACTRGVRPDEMSAQEHRGEAQKERAAAKAHVSEYDPEAEARPLRGTRDDAAELAGTAVVPEYNPTTWHLYAAERHRAHAAEHEAAAAELDRFEAAECKPFAHGVRAACPFIGPVRSVEEIPGGVRIYLAEGAPVAQVAAHMRCHLAFARARGFEVPDCPLTLRESEINVSADGRAIEMTSHDRATTRELRKRSAALIGLAH